MLAFIAKIIFAYSVFTTVAGGYEHGEVLLLTQIWCNQLVLKPSP